MGLKKHFRSGFPPIEKQVTDTAILENIFAQIICHKRAQQTEKRDEIALARAIGADEYI
jgi:hypothetical protein